MSFHRFWLAAGPGGCPVGQGRAISHASGRLAIHLGQMCVPGQGGECPGRRSPSARENQTPRRTQGMHDTEPRREGVRPVDQQLLEVLGRSSELRVGDLVELLGVTATAIRQRLDRLQEAGLIERRKLASSTRGRPTFAYALTRLGRRQAGGDYAALAEALWREIGSVGSPEVRKQLLDRVARRLGQSYREGLSDLPQDALDERFRELARTLVARRIDADVQQTGPLPVLELHSCPYPDLADGSERGEMCRLEEQAFSAAVGSPVHLSSCRMEGDSCCRFTVGKDQSTAKLDADTQSLDRQDSHGNHGSSLGSSATFDSSSNLDPLATGRLRPVQADGLGNSDLMGTRVH